MSTDQANLRRRVRIWLGDHLIAEYVAEPDRASRYQRVMTPKFTGLSITVEPIPGGPGEAGRAAAELPTEQLWPLTVQ
jgi:hypothetical protein